VQPDLKEAVSENVSVQRMHVSDDGVISVGSYVAGNTRQQWFIEKDEIRCRNKERQLRVGVEGPVTAGARCSAAVDGSNNCWLFDHL